MNIDTKVWYQSPFKFHNFHFCPDEFGVPNVSCPLKKAQQCISRLAALLYIDWGLVWQIVFIEI